MKQFFLSLILLLITGLALYSAAAGWVNSELTAALKENKASEVAKPVIFKDIQFVNEDALKRYQAASAEKQWFPWMVDLPQPIALLVTSISFGLLGGVFSVLFTR